MTFTLPNMLLLKLENCKFGVNNLNHEFYPFRRVNYYASWIFVEVVTFIELKISDNMVFFESFDIVGYLESRLHNGNIDR